MKLSEAFAGRPLQSELEALRPQLAAAAQQEVDDWDNEEFGDGICDLVAVALSGVIASAIGDVELDEYGWDGDDHAAVVARRGNETYLIDVPYNLYETGSGYSWQKIEGAKIAPEDVVIIKL